MKPVNVNDNQVVFTLEAKCRDCYRCLKVCPVKAIKMMNNQAYVVEERCIACGTCIRECPQGAKTYRND
jgi:Fe-S-cluster-containing hydrogenase component 2